MGWFDEQIEYRKKRENELLSDSFQNIAWSITGRKIGEGWIDEGFTQFLEEEILCLDTKSRQMLKEKYGDSLTGKEFEENKNVRTCLY